MLHTFRQNHFRQKNKYLTVIIGGSWRLDRADGDSLLKQGPSTCGSFLIHSKAQGDYCLTVTGQDQVIKHHSIQESNGMFHIKNDTSL